MFSVTRKRVSHNFDHEHEQEYLGDDVRVIEWKKRNPRKGRTEEVNRRLEEMDNIKDFTNKHT